MYRFVACFPRLVYSLKGHGEALPVVSFLRNAGTDGNEVAGRCRRERVDIGESPFVIPI